MRYAKGTEMEQLDSLFDPDVKEDPVVIFKDKVRFVLHAVLAVMFWGAALSMGWLMVLGRLDVHWAAFAAAELLTVFMALSSVGGLLR
jgi:hypothetical protein